MQVNLTDNGFGCYRSFLSQITQITLSQIYIIPQTKKGVVKYGQTQGKWDFTCP